jgi:hypothetical protein
MAKEISDERLRKVVMQIIGVFSYTPPNDPAPDKTALNRSVPILRELINEALSE